MGDGTLSRNLAKEVLAACLRERKRPREVVDERGLAQVSDEGELAALIDDVLGRNGDAVSDYRSGDDKAKKKKRGFLMGELMKASQRKGNPELLNKLLDERLQAG
jgi:aspartyl-tRNA(Asn)/glutamyl-tRNA(Gln) amidotransferase subunit B